MNFWVNFSYIALEFVIEFVKQLPIMILIFGFKLQSPKRIAVFGAGAVVLLALTAALEIKFELIQDIPIDMYISILLTMLIIRGNNRIIYTLISNLGICILDVLAATVWLLFNDGSYIQLADNSKNSMIVNSINIATILIICLISKAFLSRQNHISPQNAKRSYLILIMLGEISLLMFITAFQFDAPNDNIKKIMAVSLSVGSVVFLLTAIILLANNISRNHFKKISEINEKLVKSQEQYYTMLLQKEEETKKFRHDINNHLNCMRLLFEDKKYDELEEYFNKIGASILDLRPELQIGNDLISAILKDAADKYTDVSVEISGRMPSAIRLDNTDICTIFYNLFNNAFAAAESSEKKNVDISVKLLGENLFFTVKNSVSHKVDIVDNTLKTEKQDKNRHGFGSGNAVRCAEKNGGELTYKCSDTYFEAELILPNVD